MTTREPKRQPIERVTAELPDGDRPAPAIPPEIPDHIPPEKPWHGSAGAQLTRLQARVRHLELLLALAEGHLLQMRRARVEEDALTEKIGRALENR